MYRIQKIPMYNVCAADVIFRIEGTLYNSGRIIIDRDSFEFAGYLADDTLLGYYKDGKYHIDYLYAKHDEENLIEGKIFLRTMEVEYEVNDIQDLDQICFRELSEGGISLAFVKFECQNKELISSLIQQNQNLIETTF